MPRAIVIGRHRMMPAQVEELREKGIDAIEQVAKIEEDEIPQLVETWARNDVRYIVIQALPLALLYKLFREARKAGIDLIIAWMDTVAVTEDEEEARKLVQEKPDRRTYLKAPGDKAIRVIEHRKWMKIKRLEVELEPLQ